MDSTIDFEALAAEHKDAVYRQMIRACGNREDAEDVLVEALLKAYQGLDKLQDRGNFRAWLAQIARRICWQVKEHEALRPILQMSGLEANGKQFRSADMPADVKLIVEQTRTIIKEAIASLPSPYFEIYELRDIQGLTGQQVAEQLGLSLAAQKSRLHRARALVRSRSDQGLLVVGK